MMISFIKGNKLSLKINCLLNYERTVINHIIFTHRSLITARSVKKNHLNRTCLAKWSMLKEQHMPTDEKQNIWYVSVWKGL